MTAVIALIDQVAIGIYFLIAAGILFALRRYIIYGEEYRSSYLNWNVISPATGARTR